MSAEDDIDVILGRFQEELAKRGYGIVRLGDGAAPEREAVVTILAPDPYDERDGVWISAEDRARLATLPAGTKLYTDAGEVERLRAELDRYQDMLQSTSLECGERLERMEAQLAERDALLRSTSGNLIRLAASLIGPPLRELDGILDEGKRMTRPRVDAAVRFADSMLKDAAYELRKIADLRSASAEPALRRHECCCGETDESWRLCPLHAEPVQDASVCWKCGYPNDEVCPECQTCNDQGVVCTTEADHEGQNIEARCPKCIGVEPADGVKS